jgi:UPF0755 protein
MRWWLLTGVALAALAGGAALAGLHLYRQAGPLVRSVDVVVPRGPFKNVAEELRRSGVVDNAFEARVFALLTLWQGPVRAAEFSFPAGASLKTVLLILRHGRPVQHLLTVPEGWTSWQVAHAVAAASGLMGDVALPREGAFLPQSYAYERGATTASVVARGERAMAETVAEIWAARAPGLDLASPRELVVLASLVERETHLAQERPLVAAVFLNRLRARMKLQADSTVVYLASGGAGELGHGIRRDELDAVSPYNTYLVAGLPAGPICDPGRASLEAVAHPATSDALYFVADGSGGHVFARSLKEHAQNVERYRALGH